MEEATNTGLVQQEPHQLADSNGDASSTHGEQLKLSVSVPAPRHSNLYVSGLGAPVCEESVRLLFAQHGPVESCRLVRSGRDGRAFAFVKFATIPDSLAAIDALNGQQFGDGVLEVKSADADAGDRNPELLAPPSDNLYAKNLPSDLTQEELRELFAPYGTVVECRVLHSGMARADSDMGAGALVRMSAVEEAAAAIAHLHNSRLDGVGLPLIVRFADSQEQKAKKALRQQKRDALSQYSGGRFAAQSQRQHEQQHWHLHSPQHAAFHDLHLQQQQQYFGSGGPPAHYDNSNSSYGSHHSPQHPLSSHGGGYYSPLHPSHAGQNTPRVSLGGSSCSVYVKNLPEHADRLWMYEKFGPFGGVLSVRVLLTAAGTCRGVGFVNYADPDSAFRAVQAMHGMPLGGDRRLFVGLQTQPPRS